MSTDKKGQLNIMAMISMLQGAWDVTTLFTDEDSGPWQGRDGPKS